MYIKCIYIKWQNRGYN